MGVDPQRTAIANRIRAARQHAGLSQGQVARMLGLQRPAISEVEAGRRKVAAEELSQLAEMFHVSVSWLTNNKPDVPDPSVELAARELSKLKQHDLKTILQLLRTLRRTGERQG